MVKYVLNMFWNSTVFRLAQLYIVVEKREVAEQKEHMEEDIFHLFLLRSIPFFYLFMSDME